MAGGTKSVDVTDVPKTTRDWQASLAQLYADTANRKRDEKEVRTAVKVASVACDFFHAETRRFMAAQGANVGPFSTE